MLLREVDSLALSFQSLVKIDNLTGATALRKLKLDCNRITRIENLDHLVCTILWQMHCICAVYIRLLCSGRSFLCHFFAWQALSRSHAQTHLTWLNLSFNQISKIEGLDCLKNLTDLSICDNQITDLAGLDYLKELQCLSIGVWSARWQQTWCISKCPDGPRLWCLPKTPATAGVTQAPMNVAMQARITSVGWKRFHILDNFSILS
jgi:Leucine Rich repeats (2 copies)